MQSSLSCCHGRQVFKLSQTPKLSPLNAPPRTTKLSPFPRKPSPSQLSLKPHFPSHSPLPITKWGPRKTTAFRCGASSSSDGASGDRSLRRLVEAAGEAVSTAFPIWVALGCLLGLVRPSSFSWVQPKWTVMGITVTMLGMGMTLTLDDLRGALAMPKELLAGFVLQYSVSSFFSKSSIREREGI